MDHVIKAGKFGIIRALDVEALAALQILLFLEKQHFELKTNHIEIYSVSCSRGQYKKLKRISKKNNHQLFIFPGHGGKDDEVLIIAAGKAILYVKKIKIENLEKLPAENAVKLLMEKKYAIIH